jgi:hypothetical protein
MYKERIANLLNAIDQTYTRGTKERDNAIDVIEVALELFPRCASGTYSKNVTLDMAKLQVDTATYECMKSDLQDSNMWLCASTIKAMKDMNNMCMELGVEKIYDGPMHIDDLEIFCGDVVKEYFDGRTR